MSKYLCPECDPPRDCGTPLGLFTHAKHLHPNVQVPLAYIPPHEVKPVVEQNVKPDTKPDVKQEVVHMAEAQTVPPLTEERLTSILAPLFRQLAPTPGVTVSPDMVKAVSDEVKNALKAEQSNKATVEQLAELEKWRSGENHMHLADFFAKAQTCPNCSAELKSFVNGLQEQWRGSLSKAQVRELARKNGDWPPPAIEIPAR